MTKQFELCTFEAYFCGSAFINSRFGEISQKIFSYEIKEITKFAAKEENQDSK